MTEQKQRFMQQLDRWTEQHLIAPVWHNAQQSDEAEEWEAVVATVKKAVREKVFESYGAGCRATEKKLGAKRPKREKEG